MAKKTPGAYHRSLAKKMFSLMAEYKASGMTQKDFIATHGIQRSVFYYWWGRYRLVEGEPSQENESAATVTSSPSSPTGLIPIALTAKAPEHSELPGAGSSSVELVFPDGVRLSFGEAMSPSYIREFIPYLRES
jgi:hypothetical protein